MGWKWFLVFSCAGSDTWSSDSRRCWLGEAFVSFSSVWCTYVYMCSCVRAHMYTLVCGGQSLMTAVFLDCFDLICGGKISCRTWTSLTRQGYVSKELALQIFSPIPKGWNYRLATEISLHSYELWRADLWSSHLSNKHFTH